MKAQFEPIGNAASAAGARPPREEPLAPLLAGARARGMADAFEMLGVAAAFLDEGGLALHINDRARRLLGPQLWVDDGRLRAADADLDEALAAAIETALNAGRRGDAATSFSFASESRGPLGLKVLPVAAEAHDPFQLLRVVVVLERQQAAKAASAARRDGLN
ncbi:MAG: hypothetical protein ABR970_00645 [Roseiarcus sp.]|jgi:hypothetical protein